MIQVSPPKLTKSMRSKISEQLYRIPLMPWGTCRAGVVRSDKYCHILGFVRYR